MWIEENGPEVHLDDLLGMLKSSSATQKQIGSPLPRSTPARNDPPGLRFGRKLKHR
jgi:hypothetical protein